MKEKNYQNLWCMEVNSAPATIVLFGAAGDLACRKLYPALFELHQQQLLHQESRIIGCARRNWNRDDYQKFIHQFIKGNSAECNLFLNRFEFINCDYTLPQSYVEIKNILHIFDSDDGAIAHNHLFYLALPASLYISVASQLSDADLLKQAPSPAPWRHLLLEKPFGYDLASATRLNAELHKYATEEQLYRIDHYLGKETVQNISMLRFANLIFEPIWNTHYIDSVKITVAEDMGVENRGGYFDQAGVLRDMFQNHILELLSLVTMEMPASSSANDIRNEKLNLIHSIRQDNFLNPQKFFIRGQYDKSANHISYRKEAGVAVNSTTETFVAAKLFIDNWRWKNVPFYIRSGKRMAFHRSEIVIDFKAIPHNIFDPLNNTKLGNNRLKLQIYPQESMQLTLEAKASGPRLCMGSMNLDYNYSSNNSSKLDAYGRLILDALLGDQTLFIRSDIIHSSWELFTPLLNSWQNEPLKSPLYLYVAGTNGPKMAEKLLTNDGREWQN